MKKVFYSIAVLLATAWITSYFFFHAGGQSHILIFSSAICWIHAVITVPRKKYMLTEGKMTEDETDTEEQRA